MAIRQFTTPTLPLFIPGEFIANADSIYVSFEHTKSASSGSSGYVCKHGNDLTGGATCDGIGSYESNGLPKDTFTGDQIVVTEDEEGTTILLFLTQEYTGSLASGDTIKAQVNWIKNGKRYATDKASIPVTDNLLKVVLPL